MTKMKNRFSEIFKRWGSVVRHPINSAKAYVADFKSRDTKGKIVKILKTVGFILGSYFALYIGFTLLILYILCCTIFGSVSSRRGSYYAYEMMNNAETQEERDYWHREYYGY